MFILHCITKSKWDKAKQSPYYGRESVDTCGFIHCSSIENFWRVASNFKEVEEALLLLCIDTNKVESVIKWEDHDNCGRKYPHIYGELNLDSVVDVLPFLKNGDGDFIQNKELEQLIL
ncbi:uncharacterized protein (DUF952 family) [Natronobacillus azotifigens]|uniref:DUF952 domain-containing protein n=1 Tax=Natronobacillus azotifigens TaxID=472978 RepID=A0A9J6RC19_9BACI|nr:DUF952 domain-containing protein [Natronobacillus azotifigens]MCZ0702902.1 DUF952 domain-containing protein [Natronobacillus azotifigens]